MSKPLHVTIRQIGNSKGVVIPKAILEQVGLNEAVEMSVEGEKLILSKPKNPVRLHWAQDAKAIGLSDQDPLLLGDFANEEDEDWIW